MKKTETIDLHGMTVIEAKIALNHTLDALDWDVTELVVVHGYHGHVLMDFIRGQYHHPRIRKLAYSLNPGDTTFLLKSRQEMAGGPGPQDAAARHYFLKTDRLGFSQFEPRDMDLIRRLYRNRQGCRWLVKDGAFSGEEVTAKLNEELTNREKYHTQNWPLFRLQDGTFVGCCGLGSNKGNTRQFPFFVYILPPYQRQGYGREAGRQVLSYAFDQLAAKALTARVLQENAAGLALTAQLGFLPEGDEYDEALESYWEIFRLTQKNFKNRDK